MGFNEICKMLYNMAYYIYENGDVIEDGHTVQGGKTEDKRICHHEIALVASERIVLDINPGEGFAYVGIGNKRKIYFKAL